MIEHFELAGIVVQGIYAEIASRSIFFQCAVDIISKQKAAGRLSGVVAPLLVLLAFIEFGVVMAAESGYFYDLATKTHVYNSKATTNDAGIAKQCRYSFWCRIRCDIKVLGTPAE